jgi:hypothetical protein
MTAGWEQKTNFFKRDYLTAGGPESEGPCRPLFRGNTVHQDDSKAQFQAYHALFVSFFIILFSCFLFFISLLFLPFFLSLK